MKKDVLIVRELLSHPFATAFILVAVIIALGIAFGVALRVAGPVSFENDYPARHFQSGQQANSSTPPTSVDEQHKAEFAGKARPNGSAP